MYESDSTRKTEPSKRATLRDVAVAANVDASVVSRVVNADPDLSISSTTRERVELAIQELRYRPNFSARSLRLEKTMTIGYLLPSFANPVGERLIQGAQASALLGGYTVLIGLTAGEDGIGAAFEQLLGGGRVDGLLVNTGAMSDDDVRRAAHGSAPVVVVNRRVAGARCSVVVDDAKFGQMAASHLLDFGHRHIGHIGGPVVADTAVQRSKGFSAAIEMSSADGHILHANDWDYLAGAESATRLLDAHSEITGIVAANVSLAIGALSVINGRGLSVPQDMSVIAIHDASLASVTSPPITTISTPLFELGAEAVNQLIRTINGEEVPQVVVVREPPPTVINRSSVSPPHSAS